jgi:zinc transport system ATP-binding protein
MMIGLLEPERGEVLLFGEKPLQVSHEIAYVPQDTIANKDFPIKVMDVVLMGRLSKSKAFATYSKEDREIALRMLERVGMKGFENQKINTLSGGQRQRVFIARALACEAKIMFLDEPTASIDTAGQIDMFKLLKSLNDTVGIVIISHDINVALNYATKVVHVNRTLFLHDVPKSQNFRVFENQNEHVCPVELISATRCNHTHKERA